MAISDIFPLPTLRTGRLILRPVESGDAEALLALRSNASVNKYLDRPKAPTLEDVRAFVYKLLDGIRARKNAYWVITPSERDEIAGTICLFNFSEQDGRAEVGFELHPDFQRMGLMQEALQELLAFVFAAGLRNIEGWVHKENTGSIDLMQKFGFVRDHEAEAKNADIDELEVMAIYTLTAQRFTAVCCHSA
jgi:ribosomal-protein-alanine N-acetyltransferase